MNSMQYFSCNVQRRNTAHPAGYGHTRQVTGHVSGAGVRALLTRLRTSLAILLVSLESIPTSDKKKQTNKQTMIKIIRRLMAI